VSRHTYSMGNIFLSYYNTYMRRVQYNPGKFTTNKIDWENDRVWTIIISLI